MKLHLPCNLLKSLLVLMTLSCAQTLHSAELPRPFEAPEGYQSFLVSDEYGFGTVWGEPANVANILTHDIETTWLSCSGWNGGDYLITSYYRDYRASLNVIHEPSYGSNTIFSGMDSLTVDSIDELSLICGKSENISEDDWYSYNLAVVNQSVVFNRINKLTIQGWDSCFETGYADGEHFVRFSDICKLTISGTSRLVSWNSSFSLVDNDSVIISQCMNAIEISGKELLVSGNVSVIFDSNATSFVTSEDYNGGMTRGGTMNLGYESKAVFCENAELKFLNNKADEEGGAIYADHDTTLTFAGNGVVEFCGNEANDYGGAIRACSLVMADNESIVFAENKATYAGAVYAASVQIVNNKEVCFRANETAGAEYYEYKGAVNVYESYSADAAGLIVENNGKVSFEKNLGCAVSVYSNGLSISGNDLVSFSGNINESGVSCLSFIPTIWGSITTGYMCNNGSVIISDNVTSSYSGAIYVDSFGKLCMNHNSDVLFSGNIGGLVMAYQGEMNYNQSIRIADNEGGSFSFTEMRGNESVLFEGNKSLTTTVNLIDNTSVHFQDNEGAYAGGTIQGNNRVSFVANSGAISTSYDCVIVENGSVVFKDNARTYDGYGTYSSSAGAIYAMTLQIGYNQNVDFIDNAVDHYGGRHSGAILAHSSTLNGAVYQKASVSILENDSVRFVGNSVESTGEYRAGAINVRGDLAILNNGYVLFERNLDYSISTSVSNANFDMRAVYMSSVFGYGSLSLSAGQGGIIEFRDAMTAKPVLASFNAPYANRTRQIVPQIGDILFTGAYVEESFESYTRFNWSDGQVPEAYLANSRKTIVDTTTNLYDGRLRIEDGAVYEGKGIVVNTSASRASTPELVLRNGTLNHSGKDISFNRGTRFTLSGRNEATAARLVMANNSTMSFDLTGAQNDVPTLSLNANLVLEQGVTVELDAGDSPLKDGAYTILSLASGKKPASWTESHVSVVGADGWELGFSDLVWKDGALTVEIVKTEWAGTENNVWDFSAQNWQKAGQRVAFESGNPILFSNAGAGIVEVDGTIASGPVYVQNDSGYDYTWQTGENGGSLAGAMSLCKSGEGTLTINMENSYYGDTLISAGKLTAGTNRAFGFGVVKLAGGELDLAGHAMANDIIASGGTLSGADALRGTLQVVGGVTLSGQTQVAGGIEVNEGGLQGGSVHNTDILVNASGKEVSLSSDITGSSSLFIDGGNVELSGDNSYTGGTVIYKGNLTLADGSSLGSGDVELNGGTLSLNGAMPEGNLSINGGVLEGGYTLASGHVLTVGSNGMTMRSELVLEGGSLCFEGMPLIVENGTSAEAPVHIDVTGYAVIDKGSVVTLAEFGERVSGLSQDSFILDTYGNLEYDDANRRLVFKLTDRSVWGGASSGTWASGESTGWAGSAAFAEGNRVVFNTGGTITIRGEVEPASVLVDVADSLTFKTTENGSITGSGCVVKRGAGRLTLNDGNAYTGGTYLESGTLVAGGAASFGSGSILVQGGTLDLASKAVANVIELKGRAVIKGGKAFAGDFQMKRGELLAGSELTIGGKADVYSGVIDGSLSGSGSTILHGNVTLGSKGKITTSSLHLAEGATLDIGSTGMTMGNAARLSLDAGSHLKTGGKLSTGTLVLGKKSTLSLGAALSVTNLNLEGGTINFTTSAPAGISISKALTLNAGAELNFAPGLEAGKSVVLFSFKSISESNVDALYSLLGLSSDYCTLSFGKGNTSLTLTVTDQEEWNKNTAIDYDQPATLAFNQQIQEAAAPLADALVQANWGQVEASRAFVNAIDNRSMAVQLGSGERAVWASAIGASSRHSAADGHNGADTNVTGGALGVETQLGESSLLGVALGASRTRVSAHNFGTIKQDTTHFGVYGQTSWNKLSADWSAAYGRSDSEIHDSSWKQNHLQLDGRVSYNHALSNSTVLRGFGGMQYYASDSATVDGIETGSIQNLRAEIGVGASHAIGKLGVYGEVAVHQDLVRHNPTVTTPDSRYRGMNPGRTGLNFTVGASYSLSDQWSVNASYTGEVVENANAHSVNVGATYKF